MGKRWKSVEKSEVERKSFAFDAMNFDEGSRQSQIEKESFLYKYFT